MEQTKQPKQPVVLIIDDSKALRKFVRELLTQEGYSVLEADNGRAGLDLLESAPPDVALLDVEMPVMSGVEVLQAVGLKPRLYSIVLFTTHSSLEQIAAGFEMGADDYIIKPCNHIDLLARIRAAIRSSRQKSELSEAWQKAEAALIKLQQAQGQLVEQEKVSAVARLAAGAAHHINNPLGYVMSNIRTLERYSTSLLRFSDEIKHELLEAAPGKAELLGALEKELHLPRIRSDLRCLLQETQEGGQRMALIIQQLAQLELGLANPVTDELDLGKVVEPLVRIVTVLAPPETEVIWSGPEQDVFVKGSLTLLNTALVALLKNACEALGGDPGIIKVSVTANDEAAEIFISDSGAGIPPQQIESMFEPFFTTKSPESHVGLGLTIAQRFISGHGGRIFIESDSTGTQIRIMFPRLSSLTAASPPAIFRHFSNTHNYQ
ncbi:sensor histidine kinase [Citrifermentans bremense]|uniref:sensor histidine kinase n=1 Tax=Citrifermentans bremense TaxID=60035 RepID=UPI000A03E0C6|nr:response regulator [Citrifermentans bremense]